MTRDEKSADRQLLRAKDYVKDAFRILDPAAREPVARAILKALDSIDAVRKALKNRFSE